MNHPLSGHDQGETLFQNGLKALEADRFADATEAFQRALALFTNRGDALEERLRTLTNLGHSLAACQEHESALAAFKEALEVAESMGDTTQKAWQNANIGSVYRDMNRHDLSRPHYETALTLFAGEKDRGGLAAQYANLGYLDAMQGNLASAIEQFEKARTIFSLLGRLEQSSLAEQNLVMLRKKSMESHE